MALIDPCACCQCWPCRFAGPVFVAPTVDVTGMIAAGTRVTYISGETQQLRARALQDACKNAMPGDVVIVGPGLYKQKHRKRSRSHERARLRAIKRSGRNPDDYR